MSFFFRHIPTAEANFSVQSGDAVAGEDILVCQDVWNTLGFSGASRRVVSVTSKCPWQARPRSDHASTLTCWATCHPTVCISLQLRFPLFIVAKVSEISIPPVWLVTYPAIFWPFQMSSDGSSKSVIVSAAENVALTEVILTAKHEDAYLLASAHGAAFENWFFESEVIIRDGEEVFIPSRIFSTCGSSIHPVSSLFAYTVNLALPYQQGVAERGLTRFIVTFADEPNADKADSCVAHGNLEINESFLVSAVLSSPAPLSQANDTGEH